MVKITSLSEEEIEQIGEAFAYYDYADGEKGMSFAYDGKESVKEYICGYARAMLKAVFTAQAKITRRLLLTDTQRISSRFPRTWNC